MATISDVLNRVESFSPYLMVTEMRYFEIAQYNLHLKTDSLKRILLFSFFFTAQIKYLVLLRNILLLNTILLQREITASL
jgi:hypothetical protein